MLAEGALFSFVLLPLDKEEEEEEEEDDDDNDDDDDDELPDDLVMMLPFLPILFLVPTFRELEGAVSLILDFLDGAINPFTCRSERRTIQIRLYCNE
jgi:hypothetical protein